VPRMVEILLGGSDTAVTAEFDWGQRLSSLYLVNDRLRRALTLDHFGGPESSMAVIHFALCSQLVEREFVLPGGTTVGDLERSGEVILQPVSSAGFRLWLPFALLVALNSLLAARTQGAAFDRELLFFPSRSRPWRWQDFEELHAQFQVMRMKSLVAARQARIAAAGRQLHLAERAATESSATESQLARRDDAAARLKELERKASAGFSLAHVCSGALGHRATLALRVQLKASVRCFHEDVPWVSRLTDRPPAANTVNCGASGKIRLDDGVFLCAPGTALFDGRFRCASASATGKAVLVVWQDKHSAIMSQSRTVSKEFILDWHAKAKTTLRDWHQDEVVFLFLTNRPLGCDLGDLPPGLLVVAREQLGRYLSPTFAGRGLVPRADDRR
jgi:hypothetical protein